jgi:L-2-hydroxyglutarate oxidase LhgO
VTETVDAVVIGAGVVGLALARRLALDGREVLVVERTDGIGRGISSRNSEVIHSGIYYARGSLKAVLCRAGRDMLYDYLSERAVPHSRCGKLIVATRSDQAATLGLIAERASANGVEDLVPVSRAEALAMEPELDCVSALLAPSTGIVDSHALMESLRADAEAHGALFAFGTEIVAGKWSGERPARLRLRFADGYELAARSVFNCAGLAAVSVAQAFAGIRAAALPRAKLARGSYFGLTRRAPFSRLIYPVPEPGGLGIHLTLDLAGRARFGPDVEWIETEDYSVPSARSASFYDAVRRYWPGLREGELFPDYCGIRPKIEGPTGLLDDFRIVRHDEHGVEGLVNLFGIESPGLTSCLAIAELVCRADGANSGER